MSSFGWQSQSMINRSPNIRVTWNINTGFTWVCGLSQRSRPRSKPWTSWPQDRVKTKIWEKTHVRVPYKKLLIFTAQLYYNNSSVLNIYRLFIYELPLFFTFITQCLQKMKILIFICCQVYLKVTFTFTSIHVYVKGSNWFFTDQHYIISVLIVIKE